MLRRDRRNEKGVGDRPEVLCTLPPPPVTATTRLSTLPARSPRPLLLHPARPGGTLTLP